MSRLYTLFALPFVAALAAAQTPCDQLKLSFPDVTVMSIEFIPAGPFVAPPGSLTPVLPASRPAPRRSRRAWRRWTGGPAAAVEPLSPPCRAGLLPRLDGPDTVVGLAHRSRHLPSHRKLERKTPGGGKWRMGRHRQLSAMAAALREGYATASNDTGHRANDAGGGGMFALGHPEKITDFAYRAMHETVVKAKLITEAFYGKRSEVLLLQRLLHRRTAGTRSKPPVPGGFRRRLRGRSRESPRSSACRRSGTVARVDEEQRAAHAGQGRGAAQGRHGLLRRPRRREGRDHQQSGEVPLRSVGAAV